MTRDTEKIFTTIKEQWHILDHFRENVVKFFEGHPDLRSGNLPPIHSVKSRMKSDTSIRAKLARKIAGEDGESLTSENVFFKITDFSGVRVLHIFQEQFESIHTAISNHIDQKEWILHEPPKAYTWDPDAKNYFDKMGLKTQLKDSLYTSVHYVVRPRPDALACCEIQVRTLWEEIWGEVDHAINYPEKCKIQGCVEQIRVLARLVATGTQLAESILSSSGVSTSK